MSRVSFHQLQLSKVVQESLLYLPAPSSLTAYWGAGSLLGACLVSQLLTGLVLSCSYSSSVETAFYSVIQITVDSSYGWLIRFTHANGASLFFIAVYIHIGRGVYYGSYQFKELWASGVTLFLLLMGSAFLGYVLPWGQMSYWGATVITNLISAVPLIGNNLVIWVWGSFSVSGPTLSRFFTLHYLLPLIMTLLVGAHLILLHTEGSSSPLGVTTGVDKVSFHPYFTSKDLVGVVLSFTLLIVLCCVAPYLMSDPDNFMEANPMVTPVHIKPEWYFLFAYGILRSVPSKLGGVVALVMAVLMLYLLPFNSMLVTSLSNNPTLKSSYWWWASSWVGLTWIGGNPVEDPYILIGQVLSISYFGWLAALWWL